MTDHTPALDTSGVSNTTAAWTSQFGSARVLCALVVVLLVACVLFFERVLNLSAVWSRDANYSHGFLIVPISIFLAYRNLQGSKARLEPELVLGFWTIGIGCLVLVGTTIVQFYLADFVALAMILHGSTVVIGGRRWASAFTLPILFLFFMFPLPITWTNFASVWLQDWVSLFSGKVLGAFFVCHQRGNMIQLAGADQPLYVAQECSGLRQLVAFLALAVLISAVSRKGFVFGVLMLGAAIPIAILSNVLRILLMAVFIRYMGAQSVSGWLHDLPALITLPFGLLFYFMLLKSVGDFFDELPATGEKAKA